MKQFLLNSKDDMYSLLNGLRYGSVYVSFTNKEVKDLLKKQVALLNVCFTDGVCALRPTTDIPGDWWLLVWADRHSVPVLFSDDELNITELAKRASEDKCIVSLNVRYELLKIAKKTAKEYGVKFYHTGESIVFNGTERAESAYKQLERAMREDDRFITFSSKDVNPQTVRVYVSQISGFTGRKMKVSVKDDIITVFLKEPSAKDLASEELNAVLVKASQYFSYDEIIAFVHENVPAPESEFRYLGEVDAAIPDLKPGQYIMNGQVYNDVAEEKEWESAGFNSEREYLDYQVKKKADLDAWTEEENEDIIKEVEGLQQYVMPIEDTQPKKPTVEYDDF